MNAKSRIPALCALLTAVVCTACPFFGNDDGRPEADYRQAMRQLVQNVSAYAKAQKPGFLIIPQNGLDLLTANGEPTEEVAAIKLKSNGGKRLVLAYLNIGAAEDWRYYWQSGWRTGKPSWLADSYEVGPANTGSAIGRKVGVT